MRGASEVRSKVASQYETLSELRLWNGMSESPFSFTTYSYASLYFSINGDGYTGAKLLGCKLSYAALEHTSYSYSNNHPVVSFHRAESKSSRCTTTVLGLGLDLDLTPISAWRGSIRVLKLRRRSAEDPIILVYTRETMMILQGKQ